MRVSPAAAYWNGSPWSVARGPVWMDTSEVGGDGSNALVEEFVAVDSLSHSAGVLISTVGDLDRFLIALFNNQVAGADEFLASTTDVQMAKILVCGARQMESGVQVVSQRDGRQHVGAARPGALPHGQSGVHHQRAGMKAGDRCSPYRRSGPAAR